MPPPERWASCSARTTASSSATVILSTSRIPILLTKAASILRQTAKTISSTTARSATTREPPSKCSACARRRHAMSPSATAVLTRTTRRRSSARPRFSFGVARRIGRSSAPTASSKTTAMCCGTASSSTSTRQHRRFRTGSLQTTRNTPPLKNLTRRCPIQSRLNASLAMNFGQINGILTIFGQNVIL